MHSESYISIYVCHMLRHSIVVFTLILLFKIWLKLQQENRLTQSFASESLGNALPGHYYTFFLPFFVILNDMYVLHIIT